MSEFKRIVETVARDLEKRLPSKEAPKDANSVNFLGYVDLSNAQFDGTIKYIR